MCVRESVCVYVCVGGGWVGVYVCVCVCVCECVLTASNTILHNAQRMWVLTYS